MSFIWASVRLLCLWIKHDCYVCWKSHCVETLDCTEKNVKPVRNVVVPNKNPNRRSVAAVCGFWNACGSESASRSVRCPHSYAGRPRSNKRCTSQCPAERLPSRSQRIDSLCLIIYPPSRSTSTPNKVVYSAPCRRRLHYLNPLKTGPVPSVQRDLARLHSTSSRKLYLTVHLLLLWMKRHGCSSYWTDRRNETVTSGTIILCWV